MNTYEQLINEGLKLAEAKGEARGLQKGASLILLRLLAIKYGPEANRLTPLVDKLSLELQELMLERVLDMNSLDELEAWLLEVSSNCMPSATITGALINFPDIDPNFETRKVLAIVVRYLAETTPFNKDELLELVVSSIGTQLSREVVMNTYEQLINEGIELGEARGLQKGARQVIVRMLAIKFGPEAKRLTPMVNELSPELQELMEEKVLKINSLDEMQAWLQTVSSN